MTPCAAQKFRHAAGEITEIVRGNEATLLERFMPMVRRQCVTLNSQPSRVSTPPVSPLSSRSIATRDRRATTLQSPTSPHVAEILLSWPRQSSLCPNMQKAFQDTARLHQPPPPDVGANPPQPRRRPIRRPKMRYQMFRSKRPSPPLPPL